MALLEAEDVCWTFIWCGYIVVVVDGVMVLVEWGDVFGLIGESGSGKLMLGRIVLGLLQFESGNVLFDGALLSELSVK